MRETEVRLVRAPDGGYYYNNYEITEYYGRWYVADRGIVDEWVADFRTLRDVRAWLYERERSDSQRSDLAGTVRQVLQME